MKHWETMNFDRASAQRRMTVQFAAAKRLWHDPVSARIRKEFHNLTVRLSKG